MSNSLGIEIIDARRPSQNYLEALYIVEPTAYNIDCIAADYTRVPPRYAGANIFFTSALTRDLHRKVKNSSIGPHLRMLDQANIDFIPMESLTFSLGDPYALEKFYNEKCADLLAKCLNKIALKLVSLCATLGEYPIIRFYESDNTDRMSRKLPYMLAKEFQNELDAYARNHPDFPDTSEGRPRGVFLILDRSIDWIAPLLHEFTYQATVYDLLTVKNWRNYKFTETIKGKQESNEGKLSDKDPEWVSLRHVHMEKALVTIGPKLEKLQKENPHFADTSAEANVSDIRDMMLNLPTFIETRARYTMHIAMATESMEIINKHNLIELALVEQICATGTAEDGTSKPKALTDEFVAMLVDEHLDNKDKVRLIILYAMYRGGLIQADYEKLRIHAGLSPEDLTVIFNYSKLGAPVLKNHPSERLSKKELPTRFDSHATGDFLPMSRYVPGVYNVVDKLIHGALPSSLFPYIKDQPTEDEDAADTSVSLRNPRQRAVWARTGTSKVVKQRVFVFMAGGMTASESRACYELSQLHSKDVIIGGTDFTAGPQMLKSLFRLSLNRQKLHLPEDQPVKTTAPRYLLESDEELERQKKQQQLQQQQQQQQQQSQAASKPTHASAAPLNSAPSDIALKNKDKKRHKLGRFFK